MLRDEVATCVHPVPVVLPMSIWFAVTEERPVPPFAMPSVPERRFMPIDEVETRDPFAFAVTIVFASDEMARFVVLAAVNESEYVDDASETTPVVVARLK